MTYNAAETSPESGRPVEIYTFNRGYLAWRYTSADRDVVVDFQTYKSEAIRRGGIEQGSELNRSGLKITVPRDNEIAEMFRITPPSEVVTLTLRQYHEGDGELIPVWSGRVLSVSHGAATSEISLEPIATSLRRTGLRGAWQKPCSKVLYSCGVNAESFRMDATVSAVSGLTITAAALASQADGWWEGGFIKYEVATGIYEYRHIEGHTGNTITVDLQPIDLVPGTLIGVYPGCDHTPEAGGCAKFGNILNFGGIPYFTIKNPFGSDPVY